jgi:starch synthase (maltosyl-transferring)
MEPLGNDEWRGGFQVDELGQHEYDVSASVDRFASWRHEVEVKMRAGQDVSSELQEGAQLISSASSTASGANTARSSSMTACSSSRPTTRI